MKTTAQDQLPITESQDTHLLTWTEAFLFDRKAQGFSPNTVRLYRVSLQRFNQFCESVLITHVTQLTPHNLRQYLVQLEEHGHNPGGVHGFYRTLKTFLYWWEAEVEPVGWKNPIRKVKAPRLVQEPLKAVPIENVKAMLNTCDKSIFGLRDKAILLCLLDTGVRASELCTMLLSDLDRIHGSIVIRESKSKKPRTVFLGKTARRALRAYLRKRQDNSPALWVTKFEEQLTYSGLRQIIRRRAANAKIPTPGLHDFRRAFALQCLRNGMDVYSLQKLMGHADLQVLRRYLAQTTEDIQAAHQMGSLVDNASI